MRVSFAFSAFAFWLAELEVVANRFNFVRKTRPTNQQVQPANPVLRVALWLCGREPAQMQPGAPVALATRDHSSAAYPTHFIFGDEAAEDVDMEVRLEAWFQRPGGPETALLHMQMQYKEQVCERLVFTSAPSFFSSLPACFLLRLIPH